MVGAHPFAVSTAWPCITWVVTVAARDRFREKAAYNFQKSGRGSQPSPIPKVVDKAPRRLTSRFPYPKRIRSARSIPPESHCPRQNLQRGNLFLSHFTLTGILATGRQGDGRSRFLAVSPMREKWHRQSPRVICGNPVAARR